MINITIIKKNQDIITIEAKGHSGYALAGSDIVCSAISVLTQNLINSLKEIIKISPVYVINEDIPYLSVSIPQDLDAKLYQDSQLLMRSVVLGIKDVANSYKKYIKIKEKQYD